VVPEAKRFMSSIDHPILLDEVVFFVIMTEMLNVNDGPLINESIFRNVPDDDFALDRRIISGAGLEGF